MRVLDLFSGIGGFSLGLESVGMRTVGFCEIEPFPRAVLAHHWPSVPIHDDVRTLSVATVPWLRAEAARGIDLICGGFPCQDISCAGKGAGLGGARSGLWSEFSRLVGELGPRWLLAENVGALKQRGIDRVCADLEGHGYAVWPLLVGAGVGVGAPHRRERIWIVAHAIGRGREEARRGWPEDGGAGPRDDERSEAQESGAVAHSPSGGQRGVRCSRHARDYGDADCCCASELDNSDAGRCGREGDPVQAGRDEPERTVAVGQSDRDCDERGAACGRSDSGADGRDNPVGSGTEGRGPMGDPAGTGRQAERGPSPFCCRHADLSSPRWPARPGEPQHDWEEPRLAHPSSRGAAWGTSQGRPARSDTQPLNASGRGMADPEEQPRGRAGQPREDTDPGRPELPLGSAAHGLPERLARRANRESLRALGNSVVPQVVAIIGRAILDADARLRWWTFHGRSSPS